MTKQTSKKHINGKKASSLSPPSSKTAARSNYNQKTVSSSSSTTSSSSSSNLWFSTKCLHSLSIPKIILSSIIIVASAILFQNYKVFHSFIPTNSTIQDTADVDDYHHLDTDDLGGWRLPTAEVLEKYWSDVCSIERISVTDLPKERFESEIRFKKPVIVTFPNGARDWTKPEKWSRTELVKAYSKWTIHSGQSLEIVRKGGNAYHTSSFLDFIDNLMASDGGNKKLGPMHYAFDRTFYWNSKLPKTLRLPEYFKVNTSEDESIFFLGSSMTGVVFHKHSDTWNGVVYGRKRWFLYPNTKTPPGGVHHGFSLLEWVDRVYPNLTQDNRPMECIQGPGEILYLPEGTYHATLNLGDTVAVAIQKKVATIEAEILSYEATRLINFLQEKPDADPKNSFNIRLLEIYKNWLEILPESAEAVMKLGHVLFEMGEYTESLPWHMRAIKMDPYFVVAYLHLGNTFAKLRQYERAEISFKKAIEISPNLWDNYKEYGEFLLKQGRHVDALPVFKKGTELMPDMIPFWFYYKLCQMQVGDEAGAMETEKIMEEVKSRHGPDKA